MNRAGRHKLRGRKRRVSNRNFCSQSAAQCHHLSIKLPCQRFNDTGTKSGFWLSEAVWIRMRACREHGGSAVRVIIAWMHCFFSSLSGAWRKWVVDPKPSGGLLSLPHSRGETPTGIPNIPEIQRRKNPGMNLRLFRLAMLLQIDKQTAVSLLVRPVT